MDRSLLTLPLTPENHDLRRSLGYLMKLNSKLSSALTEKIVTTETDLTFVQFLALMLVHEGIANSPGDLASLIGTTSGAMTRSLDQLEHQRLVERQRTSRDRRSITIVLTEAGDRLAVSLLPRLTAHWNDVLRDFDAKEFVTLITLLEKLTVGLQRVQSRG